MLSGCKNAGGNIFQPVSFSIEAKIHILLFAVCVFLPETQVFLWLFKALQCFSHPPARRFQLWQWDGDRGDTQGQGHPQSPPIPNQVSA